MMRRVLIIGATSAIAEATARLLATKGATFYLVARNQDRLQSVADDLRIRSGNKVETTTVDLTDYSAHAGIVEQAQEVLGELDVVLVAHGTLPDQTACEASAEETLRQVKVNALSVISLLTHLASHFSQQGHGTIAVISSVAGDRGRQSNYVYGSAKAAVTIFLQGLRNRLHRSGVHVMTVKPGFVDTPMTREFQKGALWASPDQIAQGIVRGIERHKDVVYLPGFWRIIMRIIREIPEPIFKRLSL
jgi:short-subunit dehydrogenase